MVYCEGSKCKKRDTCTLHCDMDENKVYEYIDFSTYGSGQINSTGKSSIHVWCGDDGNYNRYRPSKSAHITNYDYETMWILLKPFVEKICSNHNNSLVSDILFHMNRLEDQFAPSFISQVKVEDIRKDPFENWNHYKYEDYNKCPCCNNKLHMTGQVSDVQTYICTLCAKRFALDVNTGKLTFIR